MGCPMTFHGISSFTWVRIPSDDPWDHTLLWNAPWGLLSLTSHEKILREPTGRRTERSDFPVALRSHTNETKVGMCRKFNILTTCEVV